MTNVTLSINDKCHTERSRSVVWTGIIAYQYTLRLRSV